MTETSRPWSGTTLGDAGPYTDIQWQETWSNWLHFTPSNPIVEVDKNIAGLLLSTTPGANLLDVAAGAAVINGSYYENTAAIQFAIPNGPRADAIILQKDFPTQVVRLVHVQNFVAVTQTPGVVWETQVTTFNVDGAGVITGIVNHPSKNYLNTAVQTTMIDALAVTNAKIANNAVTTLKINNLAVQTAKIDNLAVTTGKLDNLSITTGKIIDREVDGVKIGVRGLRITNYAALGAGAWQTPDSGVTSAFSVNNRVTVFFGSRIITVPANNYYITDTFALPGTYVGSERYGMVSLGLENWSTALEQHTPPSASCRVPTGGTISITLCRPNVLNAPGSNQTTATWDGVVYWMTYGLIAGD